MIMKRASLFKTAVSSGLTIVVFLNLAVAHAVQPVVSFQNEFTRFWQAAKGKQFDEQVKLWDRYVESPHQEFFDFGVWEKQFRPKWADRKNENLRDRFSLYPSLYDSTEKAFDSFPFVVRRQIGRFKRVIPDFELTFPIYAVVAPNFDAKSALISSNPRSVALLVAMDTVVLEKANYDILFPHELFHAFHALHSGFLNDGVMASTSIIVPLWEEGFATYVSGLANPGLSDGDLLLDPSFNKLKAVDTAWLARRFLEQSDSKALDPAPTDAFKMWFSSGKLKVREDLPKRSGYFLGLKVVREAAKRHSLKEMISWRPETIQEYVVAALKELSGSPSHRIAGEPDQ